MEAMNIFGIVGFIWAIVAWQKAQKLERILRENGIIAKGSRDLGHRLSEMVGEHVTLMLYTGDGDVFGTSCRVLDADETWALLLVNEGKKKAYRKLIRLEDVKEIKVNKQK